MSIFLIEELPPVKGKNAFSPTVEI